MKLIIKRIGLDLLFRVASTLISFFIIKINYANLGANVFGVWAMLLALFQWIVIFDLGLSNTLRNKLPQLLFLKRYKDIDMLYSNSFILVSFVSVLLFLAINIIFFLNRQWEYFYCFFITICSIWIVLVFSLLKAIALVEHKQYIGNFFYLLVNSIFCFFIVFFKKSYTDSLIELSSAYFVSLLFSLFISAFYIKKKCTYFPLFRYVDVSKKAIFYILNECKSVVFFQLTMLLIYNVDIYIVGYFLSAEDAGEFSILHRFFSISTLISSIFFGFVWGVFAEAKSQQKYEKAKVVFTLGFMMLIVSLFFFVFLYYFSSSIIFMWMGDGFKYKTNIVYFCFYFYILVWNYFYSQCLSGLGLFSYQNRFSMISVIAKFSLLFLFYCFYTPSVEVLLLVGVIVMLPVSINAPIRVHKEISSN